MSLTISVPPQIAGLVDWAVAVAALSIPLRDQRDYVPFSEFDRLSPLSIGTEVMSTWSVALVKTSIAFMLMRLRPTRVWSQFLYAIVAVQLLTAVFITIMQSTRCIPIQALWTPTITGKWCWGEVAFKVSMTVTSIIVIITDVIFTLIPITFLHHVRATPGHRAVIGILMSLGLLASAASIVKTYYVQAFNETGDLVGDGLSICLWASIEAQVSITAACVPRLRAAFLRFLGRIHLHHTAPVPSSPSSVNWQRQRQDRLRPISSSRRLDAAGPSDFALSRMPAAGALANQSDERVLIPHYADAQGKPTWEGTGSLASDASVQDEDLSPVVGPG